MRAESPSLARRIVACLDVAEGRVVKGVNFVDLRDAGDPAELAWRYGEEGADEVVLLDISATPAGRETAAAVVERAARRLFVPLTVGGGVRSLADAKRLLAAGADKVAVNSAAVRRPELLAELSDAFGAQAVVLAIDARREDGAWRVFTAGGRVPEPLDAVAWAREGAALGAGEILVTSMDTDGVREGFDCRLVRAVVDATTVPVVASGGAGSAAHFVEVFTEGRADAALAASIFHYGTLPLGRLKDELAAAGIPVRRPA
ncbi:MAG TPA: imidazole glycerol phosphate synthase subunit HisF [Thermoanaerobaculia bacterium]|nr:imidazole glycerol phosphate synthase subunit HisF [Thermoanaerobaculia bacterium]